jgi:hypothetical protein
MRSARRVAIDRLAISIDAVPGVSGAAFRDAVARALRDIAIPEGLPEARMAQMTLPTVQAAPGDTAESLAARCAQALGRAIREAGG